MLGFLEWPEIIFVIVVALILFGASKLPELWQGLGSGIREFFKATRDVQEDLQKALEGELRTATETGMQRKPNSTFVRWLVIWLAQGFGIGRIPWAPGTFGSVLGLGWFAILLLIAQWSPVSAGVLFLGSVLASVWTCEAAEILLGEKDPGSIVLDEIVALPTCFLGWVFHLWLQLETLPSLDFFFGPTTWFLAFGVFLAFRFFDIAKPWPVRQSQDLPRGWGVVMDDQLAALYVNLVVLATHVSLQWLT
jgi:phosphatidylglycerophosphatase A